MGGRGERITVQNHAALLLQFPDTVNITVLILGHTTRKRTLRLRSLFSHLLAPSRFVIPVLLIQRRGAFLCTGCVNACNRYKCISQRAEEPGK
jgi:hypothetical protein